MDLDIQVKATNNTLDSVGYEEYQREKNIRWKDQQPDEDIEPLIKSNNLFHPSKKDEPELQKSLNTFIKQAKKDGTFDAISFKYLRKVRETFDILNIPFFF